MISEDMDEALKQYFQWARERSPDDIGYPHMATFRRLLGGGIGQEGLSDDEAMCINAALCQVRSDDRRAYELLEHLYKFNRSLRWLELRGWGDRRSLASCAAQSRQFIRGVIFAVKIMEPPPTMEPPAGV